MIVLGSVSSETFTPPAEVVAATARKWDRPVAAVFMVLVFVTTIVSFFQVDKNDFMRYEYGLEASKAILLHDYSFGVTSWCNCTTGTRPRSGNMKYEGSEFTSMQ
jgi:hypothetical protein